MPARGAADKDTLLTAANLMSLSRVPMGLAVWLSPGSRPLLIGLMALAALSDVLDGRLARRSHRETGPHHVGAWLDPVCDKAFVIALLAALLVALDTPLGQLLLVATRELLQLPLLLAHFVAGSRLGLPRLDFRAGIPGKLTTVAQFFAIGAIILELGATWAWSITAGVLGVVSAGYYVRRALLASGHALVAR